MTIVKKIYFVTTEDAKILRKLPKEELEERKKTEQPEEASKR